ncbi:hypothetical protein, partial [Erwinia sp. ErVv1]|uniref:hypothetical protein n=1 Tax=Erwinia sp. ErVv1 TaxID=1603299 RepID=UPI001E2A8B88
SGDRYSFINYICILFTPIRKIVLLNLNLKKEYISSINEDIFSFILILPNEHPDIISELKFIILEATIF